MKGERGRIVFSLGGVDVSEEEVRIEEDGPQEISTLFIPKKAGDYAMKARFEADNLAEVMAENNEGQAGVRVVDRRLRVLLLDQAPRWEFKYLEAMLLRERRVELSCFLLEADRDSGQADGSPYLPGFRIVRKRSMTLTLSFWAISIPVFFPRGIFRF